MSQKRTAVGASSAPHVRKLAVELLEDRRLLTGVTVSNLNDVVNGSVTSIDALIASSGGDGISLREAILAANATAGADGITFAAALSGARITLGGTELAISEALTIDARPLSANVTIDAISTSRIFNITTMTGDFTLGGLVLTGGRTTDDGAAGGGGAIRSLTSGSLTLIESTVSGSRTYGSGAEGGGIFAYGFLTLTRSTVSGNSTAGHVARGGGIWNFGPALISQSTVSGNSTLAGNASGGGIWNNGRITLNESTVSGNTTTSSKAYGGGIFALDSISLTNCTVSGNRTAGQDADGGAIHASGAVTITQSTLTGNSALHATALGGGVFQANGPSNFPISLRGSIFAGNLSGSGSELAKDPGSTLAINYSLIGPGITPTSGGNNVVTANPQLYPLADNGGPTPTHALLAGSPAIDVGDPAASSAGADQRGAPFIRIFGGRVDLGAYERQTLAATMFVVTTAADELDYANSDVSLRETINSANGSVGANTVTFAAALSGATITLGGTELVIGEAVTIDARPLAANVTINANQQSRIFNITAEAGEFTLGGLALTGGRTTARGVTGSGGAIRSLSIGNLTLDQSTVSGNGTTEGDASGGGVFARGAVTLTVSTVSGNSTTGDVAAGGGIFSDGAVTLTQSTVSGNSTAGVIAWGGGIYASDAVTLTQSTISGNSTTGNFAAGGGIWAKGLVTLTQTTLSDNSTSGANAGGGGIFSESGVTLTQTSLSGNSTAGTDGGGGGVFAEYTVTLTQSTISGNSTAGSGGGVFAKGGALTLSQSTVTDNRASFSGGGLFMGSPNPLSISGSIVAGNTAIGAGDDLYDFLSTSTVNYSLIGLGITPNSGGNNVVTNAPQLGPLANYGGPTQTHAPLAGSPAINAGDPTIPFNAAQFDQRGAPYVRVSAGRIDIGAFELQPSADFDASDHIDGFDFLAWQRGFGIPTPNGVNATGDADNDHDVDGDDLAVWSTQFGSAALVAAPTASAALVTGDATSRLSPQAVDAAMAWQMAAEAPASRRLFRPRWLRAR